MDGTMDWIIEQIKALLLDPLNPTFRLYWLYTLSAVVAAFLVFREARSKPAHPMSQDTDGSFLRFLFPERVWSHPSAWLDLRYVLLHKVIFRVVLVGTSFLGLSVGYSWVSGGRSIDDVVVQEGTVTIWDWGIAVGYMVFVFAIADLTAWTIHYLQHKVPILWQFHKVHHSAEVMHPISNFREHPVDNFSYNFLIGISSGAAIALASRSLGIIPQVPTIIGVSAAGFLFNFVAYNLRHSHIWLRWPGVWSSIFPSPAHHHVHHSRHSEHIDKNFAFIFPMWDVIFGTYLMPDDNRDVEFGVTEGDDEGLDSVLGLYVVPFRDAYRVLTGRGKNKTHATQTRSDRQASQTDA